MTYGRSKEMRGIRTKVSPLERQKLAAKEWRIFTNDTVTQNAVMERLTHTGKQAEAIPTYYGGKEIPTIPVSFEIVEFLWANETKVPYKFDAYHRARRTDPFKKWMKQEKSAKGILYLLRQRGEVSKAA